MVTYYDSTAQKLPFLVNNYNLKNPNIWDVVSPGYNDSSNISAPYPKVEISSEMKKGADVWIAERSGGNEVAMFDAPYSTWTGVSRINNNDGSRLIATYPNPCNQKISIAFELKKTEFVTINVLSILGQYIATITDQSYTLGKNVIHYDVSNFPTGTYLYNFNSGDEITTTGKFSIIR
jgi:hypothetical protein